MSSPDPTASAKTIRSFAYRVLRRVHALGARSVTLDDVEQELWCAWCSARDVHDPERSSFNTLLHLKMRQHVNKWIETSFERFHEGTVALSLDASSDTESDATLGEAIPSDEVSAETRVLWRSNYDHAIEELSPRAATYLRLLSEQPPELMDEVLKMGFKIEVGTKMKIKTGQPARLTSSILFDLMDAARSERSSIMAELENMAWRNSR